MTMLDSSFVVIKAYIVSVWIKYKWAVHVKCGVDPIPSFIIC